MENEKEIKESNTSELLDKLHGENLKRDSDDYVIGLIKSEINLRDPFKWIETRIEGNDGDGGILKKLIEIRKGIRDLKNAFKKHDHKGGDVVIKV